MEEDVEKEVRTFIVLIEEFHFCDHNQCKKLIDSCMLYMPGLRFALRIAPTTFAQVFIGKYFYRVLYRLQNMSGC